MNIFKGFQMDSMAVREYKYNGARSQVILHERHLTSILKTWREAKGLDITLPETEDSDYQSLDTFLRHIFRAARGYMNWMCNKLDLPDPEIRPVPKADIIDSEANEYLKHLLDKWRLPLVDIEEGQFYSPTYTSRWGVEYCIDAMLEHAVMHPIRHEFQLRNLIQEQQDEDSSLGRNGPDGP